MDKGHNRAADEYKRQSILTASREELTLALYNGCMRYINEGVNAIEEADISGVNYSIQKAQSIIIELACSLDMNFEISYSMQRLYDYVYEKLIEANIKKKTEDLRDALEIVREFRNAWFDAMKIAKEEQKKNAV